ncbi:hypothetical protein U5A82_15835 [Sphingobium sp. CR2-8]|nr:hypothetical protein [Sphingobium sp. CR2-8]MEC3911886.1 hypothetical protein [Sphingobium sp. CR2-8]
MSIYLSFPAISAPKKAICVCHRLPPLHVTDDHMLLSEACRAPGEIAELRFVFAQLRRGVNASLTVRHLQTIPLAVPPQFGNAVSQLVETAGTGKQARYFTRLPMELDITTNSQVLRQASYERRMLTYPVAQELLVCEIGMPDDCQ